MKKTGLMVMEWFEYVIPNGIDFFVFCNCFYKYQIPNRIRKEQSASLEAKYL